MKGIRKQVFLATILASIVGHVLVAFPQDPPVKTVPDDQPSLVCSVDKPVVWPRDVIALRAWIPSQLSARQVEWAIGVGRLIGHGSKVKWDFKDVEPGTYSSTVRVTDPEGNISECSVEVIVRKRTGERPLPRLTGSSYLAQCEREEAEYGLYSYFLFASPPSEATRERYEKALEAYLTLIPAVVSLEQVETVQRSELNITYLLVDVEPESRPGVEWVLEHYDYARARVLMRALGGVYSDGPYIVSSLKPLTGVSELSGNYIFQDLSSVPPHLISMWIREFLSQAAQERFWKKRTARQLVLNLRTTLGIMGEGAPDVLHWVTWVREQTKTGMQERKHTQSLAQNKSETSRPSRTPWKRSDQLVFGLRQNGTNRLVGGTINYE